MLVSVPCIPIPCMLTHTSHDNVPMINTNLPKKNPPPHSMTSSRVLHNAKPGGATVPHSDHPVQRPKPTHWVPPFPDYQYLLRSVDNSPELQLSLFQRYRSLRSPQPHQTPEKSPLLPLYTPFRLLFEHISRHQAPKRLLVQAGNISSTW